MIHLDTSFLIRSYASGSPEDLALREWIDAGENLGVSTVAWAEYLCGPLKRSELEVTVSIIDRYIEFTPAQAELAARLFNQSGRQRRLFSDCMIAATAIAENAPLATADSRDFRRFEDEGLTLALASAERGGAPTS